MPRSAINRHTDNTQIHSPPRARAHTQVDPHPQYRTEPYHRGVIICGLTMLSLTIPGLGPTAPSSHREFTKPRPNHCGAEGVRAWERGQAWLLPGLATVLSRPQLLLGRNLGWERSGDPDSPNPARASLRGARKNPPSPSRFTLPSPALAAGLA